jgi:ADP-ribose pyrophosphatase
MFEKTIHTSVAFRGKLLTLEQLDVELENGQSAYREIIRHPGAIGVVARLDADRFVLVRQYRKAVESVMTEVVAGMLDPGEAPEAAARRELEEETGYSAKSITYLGTLFASPGYVDEKVDLFLAELNPEVRATRFDHGEHVECVVWTRTEWSAAIRSGEVRDSKTLAAWAMFLEYERAAGRPV